MLNKNEVCVGEQLADTLSGGNVYLAPTSGSPLALLVDSHARAINLHIATSDTPREAGAYYSDELVEGAVTKDQVGNEIHTVAMDAVVDIAFRAAANTMAFAQNNVNVKIRAVHERLKESEADTSGGPIRLSVKVLKYSDLWEQASWLGLVDKYGSHPVESIRIPAGFPEMDPATIYGLVKSGVSSIDKSVEAILENLPPDTLQKIYDSVFRQKSDLPVEGLLTYLMGDVYTFSPTRGAIDYVALIHLMAKGLLALKEVPDGIKASLSDYEGALSTLIGQSGRRMAQAMETRKEDKRVGRLILGSPNTLPFANWIEESFVEVNGDIYDRYLEAGGTPEILIGTVQSTGATYQEEILAGAVAATKVYCENERRWNENRGMESLGHLRAALHREMLGILKSIDDDELTRPRTDCVAEIMEHVNLLTLKDVTVNQWATIRRMICHIFYPHTDAFKFLCLVDDQCERDGFKDPEASMRSATTAYVIEWIAAMIVPTLIV